MRGPWEEVIEPVEALRKELPSTKTGFIRRALPQIDQALAQGHSLKKVWQRFCDGGLDVEYKHFCTYVGRVRSQTEKPFGSSGRPKQSVEKPVQPEESAPSETMKHDPFANLRRAEAERTVFNYRGTQDLEELVYGKRKHDKEQ